MMSYGMNCNWNMDQLFVVLKTKASLLICDLQPFMKIRMEHWYSAGTILGMGSVNERHYTVTSFLID